MEMPIIRVSDYIQFVAVVLFALSIMKHSFLFNSRTPKNLCLGKKWCCIPNSNSTEIIWKKLWTAVQMGKNHHVIGIPLISYINAHALDHIYTCIYLCVQHTNYITVCLSNAIAV